MADAPSDPYRVKVHRSVLGPGIDASALNRLVDELEDEATLAKPSAAKPIQKSRRR